MMLDNVREMGHLSNARAHIPGIGLMQSNMTVAIGLAVAGVVFLILTGVYWTHAAGSLPSFLPGYEAGSTHMHFKHGLGALILALGLFAFAWFQSGRKST